MMPEPERMTTHAISSESVLIFAPTGQDAKLIADVLGRKSFETEVFSSMKSVCDRFATDSGLILLAEEALSGDAIHILIEALKAQEVWSDIPLIVMTSSGETTFSILRVLKAFGSVGNISLLERPLRPITLESMIQGALRARRRQYEVRELLRAQVEATRVREEFISVASHELRTPLTSLKLMTQLNQRMIRANNPMVLTQERVSRLIEVTDSQVGRLTRLVEDMLDVSRIGVGKFIIRKAPVNLSELVRNSVERIASELEAVGSQVSMVAPSDLTLSLDQDRIEQVVNNLLTNVIRYAPGSPIEIRLERDEKKVILTVSDQGPGIPEEKQDRIFERFERASASNNISGLGLGLYICRQIVSSHDGVILVTSAPGKGASFRIELPLN